MPSLAVISTSLRVLAIVIVIMAGCAIPAHIQAEPIAAPPAARLARLTEFFQNEVATGKLAGAIVLIQQHGRPIYLKCFGVRDVATKRADDAGHDLCASFDDEADHQSGGDDAD